MHERKKKLRSSRCMNGKCKFFFVQFYFFFFFLHFQCVNFQQRWERKYESVFINCVNGNKRCVAKFYFLLRVIILFQNVVMSLFFCCVFGLYFIPSRMCICTMRIVCLFLLDIWFYFIYGKYNSILSILILKTLNKLLE